MRSMNAPRRLVLAGLAALMAVPAAAHPRLTASTPGRAAVVKAPPREIRVSFHEAVDARGSAFQIADAAGKAYRLGPPRADPRDAKSLVVPVQDRLPAGAYVVRWTVASAGHAVVPGLLRFQVAP